MYNNTGVALPAWSHAGTWLDSARNSGYATGTTPAPNSVAVWVGGAHGYGHVAFVGEVRGSQMYIYEGGRRDLAHVDGIGERWVSSAIGSGDASKLAGFIYPTGAPANVPVSYAFEWPQNQTYANMNYTTETNAGVARQVSSSRGGLYSVSNVGIELYNSAQTVIATKDEIPSDAFKNTGLGYMHYDINAELGYYLTGATTYYYRLYVVDSGTKYYSDYILIDTPAHGGLSGFTQTKAPTCTAEGQKQATCSVCGGVVTEAIAKTSHNYNQLKSDANNHWYKCATCSATKSKAAHADKNNDKKCDTCGYQMASPAVTVKTTPMYRLYNPNSGEHFYTGSTTERDDLKKAGWIYEGIAWYAPTNSGKPVYRMFNPNNGDHHYTMSWDEVTMLKGHGWRYENVAWNSGGNVPQYRLFNPNADCGSHHYTSSDIEKNDLIALGWKYEGIGWNGYAK